PPDGSWCLRKAGDAGAQEEQSRAVWLNGIDWNLMDIAGFEHVKADVHRMLLSQLDLEKLATASNGRGKQAVAVLIQDIVAKERYLLNADEKARIQSDLLDELFGYGPLQVLLQDPTISDILVNRHDLVYIEKAGVLEKTNVKFRDDRHLLQIIDRIV